jgi:hypothetical protein
MFFPRKRKSNTPIEQNAQWGVIVYRVVRLLFQIYHILHQAYGKSSTLLFFFKQSPRKVLMNYIGNQRLIGHPLRLAAPANSTFAQFRK